MTFIFFQSVRVVKHNISTFKGGKAIKTSCFICMLLFPSPLGQKAVAKLSSCMYTREESNTIFLNIAIFVPRCL